MQQLKRNQQTISKIKDPELPHRILSEAKLLVKTRITVEKRDFHNILLFSSFSSSARCA